MKLAIIRDENETRVAAVPDIVKKYKPLGFHVSLEAGAGAEAGFNDSDYAAAGAEVLSPDRFWNGGFDVVIGIRAPADDKIPRLKPGCIVIGLIEPHQRPEVLEKLAAARVSAFALERVPRISRAQSMDVLSSQAGIAGYRAVIEAAYHFGRFFPMLMTAAGSIRPAKVLVIGAGVAGLQAIATAKRLGAAVDAYDVRAEVKEQILSLGAKFLELDVGEEGSGQGGYAKELTPAAREKQLKLLGERIPKYDIVISTASIPGRKAPLLIPKSAMKGMRAGSVIVDLAAPTGGNCEATACGQTTTYEGVTVLGPLNLPGALPADASTFYSRNAFDFVSLLTAQQGKEPSLKINLDDEILRDALVVHEGQIRKP